MSCLYMRLQICSRIFFLIFFEKVKKMLDFFKYHDIIRMFCFDRREQNMGEFPSGQRGQTVNLLRIASMVRIRPPPPEIVQHHKVLDFFFCQNRIQKNQIATCCRHVAAACSITADYLTLYPLGTTVMNLSSYVPSFAILLLLRKCFAPFFKQNP